jgi:TetR/AcrR family transcriptional regulator, regulator of cefoperazone and chloramphenicol sensitivity
MPQSTAEARARGDATRDALISAAIDVFARDGFHGATTRSIAQAARVQQALIGYHFRHKEGLYLAVFQHIAAEMAQRIAPVISAVEDELAASDADTADDALRERHLGMVLRMVDGILGIMVRDEFAAWAQLVIREQQEPTEAFEAFYDGFAKRMLALLTRLVVSIRGGDDDEDARLSVVSILGQMLVFRAVRAGVLRQTRWSKIGDAQLEAMRRSVRANVTAQLCGAPPARAVAARSTKSSPTKKRARAR